MFTPGQFAFMPFIPQLIHECADMILNWVGTQVESVFSIRFKLLMVPSLLATPENELVFDAVTLRTHYQNHDVQYDLYDTAIDYRYQSKQLVIVRQPDHKPMNDQKVHFSKTTNSDKMNLQHPATTNEILPDLHDLRRNPVDLQPALLPREEYQSDQFVGRQAYLALVRQRLEAIIAGKSDSKGGRVIIFTGEVGLGKSWLLRHIEHELCQKFSNQSICYSFQLNTQEQAETQNNATLAMIQMMNQFAKTLFGDSNPVSGITLPDLSRQVIEELRKKLTTNSLTVFVDEVFEADWNFLELFEEYLLGPLAIEEKVLIVMAGRGRRFPWATPELRFHDEYRLMPTFDFDETKEQLSHYMPELNAVDDAHIIYELSQGVPQVNSLLARSPQLRSVTFKSYDAIIEQQLSFIASKAERQKVRCNLEALCILDAFDDDRIVALSRAYAHTERGEARKAEAVAIDEGINIRRDLVYKALARYDSGQGAYIMDRYIRDVVQKFLKSFETPATTWCVLHRAALELYTVWKDSYPNSSDRWQSAINIHQEAIKTANCVSA